MKRFSVLVIVLSCSFFYINPFCAIAKQPVVRILPAPWWIKNLTPEYEPIAAAKAVQAGYDFLLINTQEKTLLQQRYSHIAVRALNNEGVQSMSDITVDFDPAYEQLVFHKLQVIRNGKIIDKLNRDKISVIQREANLERFTYDGTQTALINLKDIRVNDIIEYAYSITGYNPIFNGRFSDNLLMEFSVPVRHLFRRLIVPSNQLFNFKYSNGAGQAIISKEGNETSYLWEEKEIPPLTFDINTPVWYDPVKHVNVSNFGSWKEVATWAVGLFEVPDVEKKELERRIAGVVCRRPADSVVIQAIRFVQDRIRYLAVEGGMNSHKPVPPVQVMDDLYGDCKSKSLLLAEILKLRGIDAWPVLVNTETGKVMEDKLPSPYAFNHCVTGFKVGGTTWYADPTISNQGGDLGHFFFPTYFWGLDLKKGTTWLTQLPSGTYTSTKIIEQFTLDRIGGGATLKVTTKYIGGVADVQRSSIAATNPSDISKEYQNFYSMLFPSIKPLCDIVIRDHRSGENYLVVEEQYSIDSMWKRSVKNSQVLVCEFYPLSFAHYFTGKKSPPRTMPYHLAYPIDYEHQTVVELPEEWSAKDDVIDRGSDLFKYHHSIHYANRRLVIVNHYQTLADFVPPKKVEQFLAAIQEVNDHLTYRLSYNSSIAIGKQNSWFSWIVAIIVTGFSLFFVHRIYFRKWAYPSPPGTESQFIGGWLIIFAIAITLSPARIAYGLFISNDFFHSLIWDRFTGLDGSLRNFVMAIIVFFELVLNVAMLVFSLLALIMFYRRRRGFPLTYVWLLAGMTIITVSDTLLGYWLNGPSDTGQSGTQVATEILQRIIYAGIAIPYFLFSRRVRETFTEPSDGTPPNAIPPQPQK